ncbi:MAG: UDP-N-acetylmuramoyl-L-alanine--D-glutamate ligase, partial [Moorea sp. SIO2B7]|nr:UDP-N-acetylmuramoyl-L-alanine--D-glutamate ligase [Moorena sp. SIO2B7]
SIPSSQSPLYPPNPPIITQGGYGGNPTPPSQAGESNPPFIPPRGEFQNGIDWVIAEISSYQIESSLQLAPQIGIWTTFTRDHLSRHKTLENYYQIKASLLHRCREQVFNGDDPYLAKLGLEHWGNAYWTSIKGKNGLICDPAKGIYIEDAWVRAFGELILPVSLFKMVGAHNQQNLLMAVAAAKLAGIEKGAIAEAIATFPGVPHRLENICTVAGVDFINDSKATNYDAAEVGLASVKTPAILIAGGEAKEGDDTGWMKMIQAKAATVLLIGDAAPSFAQRLEYFGYQAYEIVETMENAVKRGAEVAQQYHASVVLLSPACASFDQYQSFEHRGDHFRELCLQLKG